MFEGNATSSGFTVDCTGDESNLLDCRRTTNNHCETLANAVCGKFLLPTFLPCIVYSYGIIITQNQKEVWFACYKYDFKSVMSSVFSLSQQSHCSPWACIINRVNCLCICARASLCCEFLRKWTNESLMKYSLSEWLGLTSLGNMGNS